MIKLITTETDFVLVNDETGEELSLFHYESCYSNLSKFVLLTYNADQKEETVISKLTNEFGQIGRMGTDFSRMIHNIVVLSELFIICLRRNQTMRILMDGNEIYDMWEMSRRVVQYFDSANEVLILQNKYLPVLRENTFYIAILDAALYCHDFKRFLSVVRLIKKFGIVLLYKSEEDYFDEDMKMMLSDAEVCTFAGLSLYIVQISSELLHKAKEESEETKIRSNIETFKQLWKSADRILKWISGCSVKELGEAPSQGQLQNLIALLDEMESMVMELYNELDNLDMKFQTNRLKTGVMDLYLEVHLKRPYAAQHLVELTDQYTQYKKMIAAEALWNEEG